MKLRLNLSTAPLENQRPFIAGAVAVGSVGLIALLLLSHAAYSSYQSNRDLRAEIARWQQQIRVDSQRQRDLAAYFRTPSAKSVIDRSAFLNSLIDERSFPWTKIFSDLEATIPPGVRVISITPHLVDGRAEIAMQVGVNSNESEIRFLQTLEKSSAFSAVMVTQVHPMTAPNMPDRIVLSLTVRYITA